jgi:succinoglycan biosynthesis transport protein ExoP
VRDADAKIQAFRRAKGLMRGQIAPITAERLTSGSQQLTAAETARAEAAARLREIQADQAHGSADAPAVLTSRAVADLKQQMTSLSAQLASAAFVLGPKHPSLQALQREYDILRERLANEIASVAASAQKSYDAADALVAALKSELESIKADAVSATADEASIESMVRSTDIKRQKYSELYKRASELETERRVLVGSTRLVSMAELPNQPFFPKRVPFLAAGFTIAFLLAFGAALLRDRSDRSVRASSELAVMARAPIFAQLPRVSPARTSPLFGFLASRDADLPIAVALKSAPDDPVLQDALRKLYAGVVISDRNERLRTILVTSARPREGKTFTTLALAQLVAATGRRVLVVECDMRAPTFVTALGLMPSPGLAAVLRGILPPREVVVRTGIPNLDAIPAGRPTTDSTELLMSKHVDELLHWAESYDLVLLDSPPSDMMMDARMLAKQVDGVLYCARWGRTSIASAAATIADIRAVGGNVFGVAITMVKPDDSALYESMPASNVAYLEAG